MKRLGIKLTFEGQNPMHVVCCDASRKPCGGGRVVWLSTFKYYALKLNLVIDDIQWHPMMKWK
jgi:hypothetical protein